MAAGKKTLVLGASPNPSRYSHLAVKRLLSHNHPVVAIGKRPGQVGPVEIQTDHQPMDGVHTVTLYLNPQNQRAYYNYILSLQPRRIIFNPGTENSDLEEQAKAAGIETVEGCTLVMLGVGLY
jgi:predicted CoA-binding protein